MLFRSVFADRPFGGVIRVGRCIDAPWEQRLDLLEVEWATSAYAVDIEDARRMEEEARNKEGLAGRMRSSTPPNPIRSFEEWLQISKEAGHTSEDRAAAVSGFLATLRADGPVGLRL